MFDPKKRLTVEEALSHPYFEGYVCFIPLSSTTNFFFLDTLTKFDQQHDSSDEPSCPSLDPSRFQFDSEFASPHPIVPGPLRILYIAVQKNQLDKAQLKGTSIPILSSHASFLRENRFVCLFVSAMLYQEIQSITASI